MKKPKIIIGCEYSGTVRSAFRKLGFDAWSCDLLPSEDNSEFHIQDDILKVIKKKWDLGIFHPPCTHLAVSGARWLTDHWVKNRDGDWWHDSTEKRRLQKEAIEFFMQLVNSDIPMIAIENPVCIMSTKYRKPDQVIQPHEHGHGETKATCLWLKNLPKIIPTRQVAGRKGRIHGMTPSPDRWKERSRTYTGIAAAFAKQWGMVLQPLDPQTKGYIDIILGRTST